MNEKSTKKRFYIITFHLVAWLLVVLPAVLFVPEHMKRHTEIYFLRLCLPLLLCSVFYFNYLFLVPRYFVQRRFNVYVCVNLIVMAALSFCMKELMEMVHSIEFASNPIPSLHQYHDKAPIALKLLIDFVRNIFPLFLSAALATSLRLALRWQEAEDARREMEIQKTEAELSNLRSQTNPHFLLNTLNNIYALISFDKDRAQRAVLSLSSLLRQMLYGGKDKSVKLADEVAFLRNYVELMKLRISKNVEITFSANVPDDDDVRVAPFIFISLVENAFKHGISPTLPSFISINLEVDNGTIIFDIRNSNHPKGGSDKSGHGIGLKQVAKRLSLAYPGKYAWNKGIDNNNYTYFSKITIYDIEMRDNRR